MKHKGFEEQADKWWNESSSFDLLHKMNPIRLKYIRDHISIPEGKTAIDVGCGGGILTIPMARMGIDMNGMDPGQKNIEVAKEKSKLAEVNIKYYVEHVEEMSKTHKGKYDIVTSMEVIEHVDNYKIFIIHLCKLLKPGGLLFISTINRTIKSFAEAIFAAEYIFGIVPKGTHEWNKFLKPSEIVEVTSACDMSLTDITGIKLNPLKNEWYVSDDNSVNYIMCLRKHAKN